MTTRIKSLSTGGLVLLVLAMLEQAAAMSSTSTTTTTKSIASTTTTATPKTFTITNPPANATLTTGSNIILNCDISTNYSGFFLWRTYLGANTLLSKQIYTCPNLPALPCTPPENPSGSTSYVQSGSYGLGINNVDWTAGAWYGCRFQEGDVSAFASLVVIDKIISSFVEPIGSNVPSTTPGNLIPQNNASTTPGTGGSTTPGTSSGQPGQLVCTVLFGAPTFLDPVVKQNRLPQLTMNFDGINYNSTSPNAQLVYSPGLARQVQHNMTLTVTRPLTQSDIGKTLTCSVSTISPVFTLQDSVQYPIDSSNDWKVVLGFRRGYDYDVNDTLYQDTGFAVNDTITCEASAHPNAQIHWISLSGAGNTLPVYSNDLLLTESMLGYNEWKCVVLDSSGRERNSTTLSFNVTEHNDLYRRRYEQEEEEAAAERRRALGLGLGLGLGLLFLIILVILILFCCIRRKKQYAPAKTKPGTASGSSVGYSHLVTQAEPTSEPRQAPIYHSPVLAPRLGSGGRNTSPVPSEESSVNQSGHGDLGFKPASIPSRSNSRLNASIDRPQLASAPPVTVRPNSGFGDVSGTVNARGRSPFITLDASQESTSAMSTSAMSSASSVNPNRSAVPVSYLQTPRSGAATGV